MNAEAFEKELRGLTVAVRVDIQSDPDVGSYSLRLDLAEDDKVGSRKVRAIFTDVSGLSISGFGGGLSQFLYLVVEDLRDRQLDRMSYRILERERDALSFYCRSMEIEREPYSP